MLALSEFSLNYVPVKVVKGQVIANFLASHSCVKVEAPRQNLVSLCH